MDRTSPDRRDAGAPRIRGCGDAPGRRPGTTVDELDRVLVADAVLVAADPDHRMTQRLEPLEEAGREARLADHLAGRVEVEPRLDRNAWCRDRLGDVEPAVDHGADEGGVDLRLR